MNETIVIMHTACDDYAVTSNSIIYCKVDGRHASVWLSDGSMIPASHNMKYMEEQLLSSGMFFRCHAKYLVNVSQIAHYNMKIRQLTLVGEQIQLPLAKNRCAAFQQRIKNQ
jgi:DNA-binding LytR/AlgR family response regulator